MVKKTLYLFKQSKSNKKMVPLSHAFSQAWRRISLLISLYLLQVIRSSSELRNPALKITLKPPLQAQSNALTICTKIVILAITKDRQTASGMEKIIAREARVRECAKITRRVKVRQ